MTAWEAVKENHQAFLSKGCCIHFKRIFSVSKIQLIVWSWCPSSLNKRCDQVQTIVFPSVGKLFLLDKDLGFSETRYCFHQGPDGLAHIRKKYIHEKQWKSSVLNSTNAPVLVWYLHLIIPSYKTSRLYTATMLASNPPVYALGPVHEYIGAIPVKNQTSETTKTSRLNNIYI